MTAPLQPMHVHGNLRPFCRFRDSILRRVMILVMMFDGGSQSRKFSPDKNSIDVVISHNSDSNSARRIFAVYGGGAHILALFLGTAPIPFSLGLNTYLLIQSPLTPFEHNLSPIFLPPLVPPRWTLRISPYRTLQPPPLHHDAQSLHSPLERRCV